MENSEILRAAIERLVVESSPRNLVILGWENRWRVALHVLFEFGAVLFVGQYFNGKARAVDFSRIYCTALNLRFVCFLEVDLDENCWWGCFLVVLAGFEICFNAINIEPVWVQFFC